MNAGIRALALAAALAVVALPTGDTQAIDITEGPPSVSLDVTNSIFFNYHAVLDDPNITPRPKNVFELRDNLNLRLSIDPKFKDGPWSVGAVHIGGRVDIVWFPNPPSALYQTDIRPEVLYIKGSVRHKALGRLNWTIGDDYVSLGRGMALNLRKVDELGFDMTLRGAHLTLKHKMFTLRLHGGVTNVVNVDSVSRKLVPDPNDVIFAARAEVRPVPWMRLGAHIVDIERRNSSIYQALSPAILDGGDYRPLAARRYIRSTVVGGDIQLLNLADSVTLYAEGNVLLGHNEIAGTTVEEETTGYAVYASMTALAGPVTISAEFKHYDDFRLDSTPSPESFGVGGLEQTFGYIDPPTLERFDQRVQENTDVTAGRLQVDFSPNRADRFFVSGAAFWDAPVDKELTLHIYGGWEHRENNGTRWVAQTGYRYEGGAEGGATRLRMVHFDLDLYLQLDGPHDLQWHWSHEYRGEDVGTAQEDEFHEGTTYLSWNWSPNWSFTIQLEYRNSMEDDLPVFPGAHIMYRFTSDTYIRLFGGREKGGLKCAGGVCRIFPDFEGVRLDATVRF